MGFIHQVFAWFTSSGNWTGANGIPELFWATAKLSVAVVITATVIGGTIGAVAGHSGRGSLVAVNAANAARAVPTLALLTLLAIVPSISIKWGGFLAAYLALIVLAVPPVLTNTYVGMREVDADVRDAATAMGLTGRQVFSQVELPLAMPFAVAGIRTAAVEVVATSTLAAYVSYTDLGTYVLSGLSEQNYAEAFGGSVLVALLAALVAVGFGFLRRLTAPGRRRRADAVVELTGA